LIPQHVINNTCFSFSDKPVFVQGKFYYFGAIFFAQQKMAVVQKQRIHQTISTEQMLTSSSFWIPVAK
jgi:hypothetical protein